MIPGGVRAGVAQTRPCCPKFKVCENLCNIHFNPCPTQLVHFPVPQKIFFDNFFAVPKFSSRRCFFFYTESLNTSFFILEFYIRIILGVLVNCQRSSGAIFDPMVTRQLRSRSSRCPDQRFLCFTMYGTGYSWHVLSWTEPDFPRPLAFQGYRFI